MPVLFFYYWFSFCDVASHFATVFFFFCRALWTKKFVVSFFFFRSCRIRRILVVGGNYSQKEE